MATCKKCGQEIADDAKFCPACGASTQENASEQTEPVTETPAAEEPKTENANAETSSSQDKFQNILNTKDTTADYDAQDIENNKVMGILAYLSWLVLIPLFGAKESKFARFHCNQGIILAIIEIVVNVVLGLLSLIPPVGWLFATVEWLVNTACLLLSIFGIVNAANGKAKELPFVGKYKILK